MSGDSRAAREHGWDGGRLLSEVGCRHPHVPDVGAGRRPGMAAVAAVRRIVATLRVWGERAHQRRQLAELDDRLLRDIGLSRFDVVHEIRKPFWRP